MRVARSWWLLVARVPRRALRRETLARILCPIHVPLAFTLRFGHWKGARIGLFCYGRRGSVDLDAFRYRYGPSENAADLVR